MLLIKTHGQNSNEILKSFLLLVKRLTIGLNGCRPWFLKSPSKFIKRDVLFLSSRMHYVGKWLFDKRKLREICPFPVYYTGYDSKFCHPFTILRVDSTYYIAIYVIGPLIVNGKYEIFISGDVKKCGKRTVCSLWWPFAKHLLLLTSK